MNLLEIIVRFSNEVFFDIIFNLDTDFEIDDENVDDGVKMLKRLYDCCFKVLTVKKSRIKLIDLLYNFLIEIKKLKQTLIEIWSVIHYIKNPLFQS